MRKSLFLLLSLFCLTISAQKIMSLDQVYTQWQSRNLKVDGGTQANILQMVQSFQKMWPTYSGGELIKFSKSKQKYDNVDKVVDLKNGYILYSEDDPDSVNDEQMQACVWRRSNGHSLFAINFHRFSSELDVLCFYDYNPQTKTLTPEKSLDNLFKPSFTGYRYRVWLPQNGKNLVVEEFFGALTIKHTYSWDGMKPVNPQVTLDRMEFYQSSFAEKFSFADEHPLTQYALIDIDLDGVPELWLCSDDESYQAVFAVKLTIDLLGGQDDRRTLSFYKGAVCHSGHCGAGCMSSVYCLLEDSSRKTWLQDLQEYDYEKDEFSPSVYTLNADKISAAEGERIINSLGKEIKRTAHWVKLAE